MPPGRVSAGAASRRRLPPAGARRVRGGRRVVINADDLGHSGGVNLGVAQAHDAGVVTSASLMVNGAAAVHAARLAAARPGLSVGLHFVAPADTDIDDADRLAAELARQLARFRELTGREPSHLDSHHHVHADGDRMDTFRTAARELGVPIRHRPGIRYIGGFYGQWEAGVTDLTHLTREYLLELVATEAIGQVSEISCHPAAHVRGLRSSYGVERLVELETLTSPGLAAAIADLGVTLVTFDALR